LLSPSPEFLRKIFENKDLRVDLRGKIRQNLDSKGEVAAKILIIKEIVSSSDGAAIEASAAVYWPIWW
jgi:hypothetical protein